MAVIGGGVVGLCLAAEAARGGQTVALFEREARFGAATSGNWFRILHGGLRYLQSMDLIRHRESVAARREWLRDFPDLVEPLPCLMPLTGRGLKRPSLFHMAFAMDAVLAPGRNRGVRGDRHIAKGQVLGAAEVRRLLPELPTDRLRGGALWFDAVAKDAERLVEALAERARAAGAALHTEEPVEGILVEAGRVRGLRLRSGAMVKATIVINATGPWTDLTLAHLPTIRRRDHFRPSLAINLVLDRPAPFAGALAVQATRPNAPVLFVYPLGEHLFAGTWNTPWTGGPETAPASPSHIQAFIEDLANALPWLDIRQEAILSVQAGFVPVETAGTIDFAARSILVDHGRAGGPSGLFSLAANKFTTAPLAARSLLARAPR